MILRSAALTQLQMLVARNPVVAILGARQVGKSTLARSFAAKRGGKATTFDLENPADLAQLRDPYLVLEPLRGLVILDEVQRLPDVFQVLRVLVDRPRSTTRFLVLGSAAPDLLRQGSETLAGRIAFLRLNPFDLSEVGGRYFDRLWLRGGFPRSFTARSDAASAEWRRAFEQTFLERDLPQLDIRTPAATLGRFWNMLAHYHGQIWNGSEFARAFGVSDHAVRRYLDQLSATFVIRQLRPWSENIGKRQVKSPKVYVADSGLLHSLLDIDSLDELLRHPKVGASWEGFVIENLIALQRARADQCYFWATHSGAELDLLIMQGSRRLGFEIKRTTAPEVTRSMRSALEDLRLDRLDVVHAGPKTFPLAPRIRAVSASRLLQDLGIPRRR
jgi:hypothetical protein